MSTSPWAAFGAWRPLVRIGGLAALLFVACGVAALALYVLNSPPVSGGEATLRFIAGHRSSYVAQQLLWLVPALFGLLVFVALLVVLFPVSPSLAVVGFAVGGASWTALLAVPVTSEGTLSLVYLSDQYTASASAAARSAFSAAAEALVAENNTVSLAGVLTPLGILLISIPLIRGALGRWVGWLGVFTGAVGLVSESMRFVTPALYGVYGPLMWLWFVAIGILLLRASARSEMPETAPVRSNDIGMGRGGVRGRGFGHA